jgi:paraquat-inducible protein B
VTGPNYKLRDDQDAQGGLKQSDPPHPIIKKMRWPFPLIWIVPVLAAALAGYFLYQRHQELGSEITIEFAEARGLKVGESKLVVHGVVVGQVQGIDLSDDLGHAVVKVRLSRAHSSIARQQTVFWLVRPQISLGGVTALDTVVTGPYIEADPGAGPSSKKFKGLMESPVAQEPGIHIVLHANEVGTLVVGAPLTYRGIQVGTVEQIQLGKQANTVDMLVRVWRRYVVLIRTKSQFWPVKGAEIKGGLFTGVQLKLDSIRSILTGGIAFATPEKDPGNPVPNGAQFILDEQPKPDWLKWQPKFDLPADQDHSAAKSAANEGEKSLLPSLKH